MARRPRLNGETPGVGGAGLRPPRPESRFVIGLDLHGTLLDGQWRIQEDLRPGLAALLRKAQRACEVFVCTGNDLEFVERYVPAGVREALDGYVLETGCVVSDGRVEEVVIPRRLAARVKELEAGLRARRFPVVKYFGRRLITVSLFTRDERGGPDPAGFAPEVARAVEEMGFGGEVVVTYSSVAVDIIPAGWNKMTGLAAVARGLGTIGVADSMNDLPMLLKADYAFAPANLPDRAVEALRSGGREVAELGGEKALRPGVVYRSGRPETQGVMEILERIAEGLRTAEDSGNDTRKAEG